ncbi:VOC family protein [Geodermatophilus sp. SYSU D00710]
MTDAPARFKDLCIDARDHQALADWWCAAIGYVRRDTLPDGTPRERDWPVLVEDPAGRGPELWFNPVPEPKTVKNRVHLDVVGDSAALQAAGATVVRASDERPGHEADEDAGEIGWDVLADPEGNEFCCFPPQED